VQWLNEPARWSAAGQTLTVSADAGTDFWRTTHYGFVHDTGHLYGEELGGDFDLSVLVRGGYAAQYDQAGVMVRIDERRWLKTGIEFVDGQIRFCTVVTLDYSSWAVAGLPPGLTELELVLARRGDAVEVHYRADAGPTELAAVAYLPPREAVLAGPRCAAPEGGGFEVAFRDLRIVPV
jgi:uncharacterized protein